MGNAQSVKYSGEFVLNDDTGTGTAKVSTSGVVTTAIQPNLGRLAPDKLEVVSSMPTQQWHPHQLSLSTLLKHPETAVMVKEWGNVSHMIRSLKAGQRYQFVQLDDGRIRGISIEDVNRISTIITTIGKAENVVARVGVVGHASLVDSDKREVIIAAGEIHANSKRDGCIANVYCLQGFLPVPIQVLAAQFGPDSLRSLAHVTFESEVFNELLIKNPPTLRFNASIKDIIVYSPTIIVVVTDQDDLHMTWRGARSWTPWKSSTCVIAFHETDCVRVMGFSCLEFAEDVYHHWPEGKKWVTRMVVMKLHGKVLDVKSEWERQCESYVRAVCQELENGR
ncbi:hypothetical protein AX17_005154 [Amanita inopinata Kibby_2008]|nr:hypothetical protein AX17_005154 [Amanita inopinata Kibby_2008]